MDSSPAARDTVFISHAMPEDGDFAVWLGVQLASQGYRVWSEATQLIGGERFWNEAEDEIRTSVAKFVAVVSRSSRRKDGVQNELDFARAVAKRLEIPSERFIQPVVIGDLAPDDLPIQLSGRNALSFVNSWAEGLSRLLKVLERDAIPKAGTDVDGVGAWVRDAFSSGRSPLTQESTLATNACRVLAFPKSVFFYEVNAPLDHARPDELRRLLPWPAFVHGRLLGTFATPEEVLSYLAADLSPKLRSKVDTETYIAAGSSDPAVERRAARNHLTSMLREGWDALCVSRGLSSMQTASKANCWFHPAGGPHDGKFKFTDIDGKLRRKALRGVKTRKAADGTRHVSVHWHFAPSARATVGDESQIALVPHVAFTLDGAELIGDAEKAHKIRRSFCRSWWNEQWRTLHLAYVASLRVEGDELLAPVSPTQMIRIDAKPDLAISPMAYEPPPRKARGGMVPSALAPIELDGNSDEVPEEDEEIGSADINEAWDREDDA